MNGIITKMVMKDGKEMPYAFITGEDQKQYFLHRNNFLGDWFELSGRVAASSITKVKFDAVQSPKGPRAEACDFL
jgi:cold shock CspA family protein